MSIRGFLFNMNNLQLSDYIFIENNKDSRFKVFIYNSLKSEFNKFDVLSNSDCFLIGDAVTKNNYTLYDLGDFPLMSDIEPSDYPVRGELYEVSSTILMTLDRFHHLSKREEIELIDGTRCYTYIASLKLNNKIIQRSVDNQIVWGIKK